MTVVGEGAEVTWMIRLGCGEFCDVGVRFSVCFGFVEITVELFLLRWIGFFVP